MAVAAPAPVLTRWARVDAGPFRFRKATADAPLVRPRLPLQVWNTRVRPEMTWDWRHLVMLQAKLDQIARRELRRLIVELPVRHGKSETGTVSFPAQTIDVDPSSRVIVGSYNATLATKFSRKIRRVAIAAGVNLSDERNAADDWETTAGGGVRAVGVGAGVTGHGGDLIVVDDPVKSREEAESAVFREKVWDWFTSDLLTRLEPGGALVIIMSRWHQDDLVGRILASEDADTYDVLRLPALAEDNDPMGRLVGEALCPQRYDADALAAIRRSIGEYPFASLFQQAPQPRNAGMFPREQAQIVDAVPAGVRWLRWWDRASTAGGGDATAGAKVGLHEGLVYIVDVTAARLDTADRDKLIRQTAELDGRTVVQWGEQEPGSAGKDAAGAFVRLLAGWPVHTEPTTGSKADAMDPLSAQWQAGNVRLLRGPWNESFLTEAAAAPFGKHDDQIEAASRAYNKLVAPVPIVTHNRLRGSRRAVAV